MKQQIAQHTYSDVPRRASAPPPQHRTGIPPAQQTRTTQTSRNAGVYDPCTYTRAKNPYKATYQAEHGKAPVDQEWYEEEDEPVYTTRPPRSAVVYRRPYTHVEPVTRTEDLPEQRPRHGLHPLVYIGISMLIAVVFLAGYLYIPPAMQRWSQDRTYGYPRTFQMDENVGHNGISHFIVINDKGTIKVIEIPQDPTRNTPHLYVVVRFTNPGADLIPATITFGDLSGHGRMDMEVKVYETPDNPSLWVLFNTGTIFAPHL